MRSALFLLHGVHTGDCSVLRKMDFLCNAGLYSDDQVIHAI